MDKLCIEKFYPTAEELSFVCSKVKCPEDNCEALFQCTSNLNMHLIKHHKIKRSGLTMKKASTQYFCPALACPYHKDSKKHFTKLKYLKQHFLKVHALKQFVCEKCEKKFSTRAFLALHMKNCGKIFTCICGSCFNSSEAILTHIKRKGKGHENAKSKKVTNKSNNNISKRNEFIPKKEKLIYPKITNDMPFSVHYIAAVALSELSTSPNLSKAVDKSIQTEAFDFDLSKNQVEKFVKNRKTSQQTQTTSAKNKKLKISIQTQTSNDYLKRKGRAQTKASSRKKKKCMETQTKYQCKVSENEEKPTEFIMSNKSTSDFKFEKKCTTEFNIAAVKSQSELSNTEEKARKWLWEMVSSSSGKTSELDLMQCSNVLSKGQTHCGSEPDNQINQVFDLNKLCNIETQTDIDAFLTECNEDTNFTLCSTTETQTTDNFDCMLYSNMCTQTCDEVNQLFNFNFVHNETQTAWPDLNDCHELSS